MKTKIFENKSIIIAIPNHFGLPIRFKENLEFLGFKVYLIEYDECVTIGFNHKVIHGYKKFIQKDKTHKPKIKNKIREQKVLNYMNIIPEVDYALVIRPDLFSFDVINTIKNKAQKTVAYQWDGINRFPLVKEYIPLFDNFYVFDKNDIAIDKKLKYTTNFYFDDIQSEEKVEEKSVFFVGTYMKERIGILQKITEKLENNGLKTRFLLFSEKETTKIKDIKIINQKFSFKENILQVQASEYLLDLHNPIHNGLSFRTFESIGYQKKLITNNPLVKEFDFYNPNNIYLIENDNFIGFEDFVKQPYIPFPDKEKYSFTQWLKNMLTN